MLADLPFRDHSVIVMEDTELMLLKTSHLQKALLLYPDVKSEMKNISDKRIIGNNLAINVAKKSNLTIETQKYYSIYLFIIECYFYKKI